MINKENNLKEIENKINMIFKKTHKTISLETEKIIDDILNDREGQKIIIDKIINRNQKKKKNPEIIDGLIYQKIININNEYIQNKLVEKLPKGIINLQESSFKIVNYENLQTLLIYQKFQEADKLTQQYLCDLTKQTNTKSKKWLYFTDIQFLQKNDLFMLDLLWKIYSKGKFGFSVQKEIWIKNNKNWDKLWEKIYWLRHGIMKRYPEEFTWTIDAPEGHLPLSNQIRGTKTLLYLFHNIEW